KYPALDVIAPEYGGTHKVDGVKILWEQGHLTSEIDPELLREYLLGTDGDIENTRRVFYGQYGKLVQRGMWDMALTRMEAGVFNSLAMYYGMHVDTDLAYKQLDELTSTYNSLVQSFEEQRAKSLPPEVEFK